MNFNYSEYKENQNIIPTTLPEKEKYYQDLNNIEWGMTGRLDAMFSNQFFYEAVQLIINAITLFEKGYFDCAFYSLRQSLEISTTTVYFADDTDESRKTEMNKWQKQERFPQQNQMINQLVNRKTDFANIKQKMHLFFEDIEAIKQKMNKYVHKQGLDKFYSYRTNEYSKVQEKRLNDFTSFLTKSIGAVAVFRLAIDPMPVMLLDEDIYKRTRQLMTENFSPDFVNEYIGEQHLLAYKETNIYKGYYDSLIVNEEMKPSVLSLVKDDFVNRENCEEILSQVHLLGKHERIAVCMTAILINLTKIYTELGYHWYWTNTKSERISKSFSSSDFDPFRGKAPCFNQSYDNVFLSIINIHGDEYYLEHNLKLNNEEIALINFVEQLSTQSI